jgi:hypothetical protein
MSTTVPSAVVVPDAPLTMLRLAGAYHHNAATHLPAKAADVLAAAPARLCAVQAFELYLVAYLRAKGVSAGLIKSWRHDLSCHVEATERLGLVLRRRTRDHLVGIARAQEYLNLRYHPQAVAPMPRNRLTATLDELSAKVGVAVTPAPCAVPVAEGCPSRIGD